MTTMDDQLTDWIENTNNGQGPTPVSSVMRSELDALIAALHDRDQAERGLAQAVSAARANGASWAVIGATIGMTRQGAHKKYARAD